MAGGVTPAAAQFGGGQTVYSLESKHFRFLWNDTVAAQSAWRTTMAYNTLRNAEECWQVFVNKMGYREPAWAMGAGTSGTRYKLNITTWHSGYWAGGDGSYARLNITPDGLRENPPSGVIPHELMHCFQFHNTSGNVPGAWREGHANYGRERYNEHFRLLYLANQRSGIDPTYLRCAHQIIGQHAADKHTDVPGAIQPTRARERIAPAGVAGGIVRRIVSKPRLARLVMLMAGMAIATAVGLIAILLVRGSARGPVERRLPIHVLRRVW